MKNLKSVLAVLAAICLLLCLTVPVFATENLTATGAATSADAAATQPTGTLDAQPEAEEEEGDIQIPLDDETVPVEEEEEEHDHAAEEETESTGHKVIRIILIVLEVIASIALIVIVLVQTGKESGLSGAIAGNSESYMGKGNRATLDKKLASMTKWVALAWVLLTLALSLI